MKFLIANIYYRDGPVPNITTGISSIGQALCYDGNSVIHRYHDQVTDSLLKEKFDCIICSMNRVKEVHRIYGLRGNKGRFVIFADGVAGQLEYFHVDLRRMYINMLRLADKVIVNSKSEVEYLKVFLDNPEKIICLGFPVNVQMIDRIRRDPIEMVPGKVCLGYFTPGRVFHNTVMLAKLLNDMDFKPHLYNAEQRETTVKYRTLFTEMGIKNAIVSHGTDPETFLKGGLLSSEFALYFSIRPSLGRTAAECAVAGIPVIGNNNYFQEQFFPDLMVTDPFDIDTIKTMVNTIVFGSRAHIEQILARAREQVVRYIPHEFAKRLVPALMEE